MSIWKRMVVLVLTVHCYISVAEKHKTMLRLITESNKHKQIIEFNPITAIEYSSCYKHTTKVMIQNVITQWEENKLKLEEYFTTTKQNEYSSSYKRILEKIIELVIVKKDDYNNYAASKITVVDDGDYQGTQIFLIPTDTYQPSIEDYLITNTYYGSCSGCDTLQSISNYDDDLPTEEQVKEYMTLALHLVQKMKTINDND